MRAGDDPAQPFDTNHLGTALRSGAATLSEAERTARSPRAGADAARESHASRAKDTLALTGSMVTSDMPMTPVDAWPATRR